MSFIHLQCHTENSLLESPLRIGKLLDRCEELGMESIAITDHGVMFGVMNFYIQAKKRGIRPIIGCEMYLTPDINQKERGLDRLILLSKNYKGYQNLIKLVSISHLEGFYYKPRIDLKHLAQYSEDLIAISPGLRGPIAYRIQSNRMDEAKQYLTDLKDIYKENFYLGLQKLDLPFEDVILDESKKLSKEFDVPLVALNDVHYLHQDKANLKNILRCVQTGKRLEDDTRLQFESDQAYLKTQEQMNALFDDVPEALENTVKIASQCDITIQTDQVLLPHFKCPDGLNNEEYLRKLIDEGINKKYKVVTQEIKDRVAFEMSIILKMGYAPYFLIIYDFLDFCVKEDIPVGPGRGSAAGSIVAYALNITKIDPIEYKLLFERFLNPERVSMPDIDIDFCIKRRSEVIDYIVRTYGAEQVSQIVTFGTMAARGVIRDVGRVLNVPLSDVDRIAKLIPSTPGQYTSIPEALEEVEELKTLYDNHPEFKELLDIGIELEGVARHSSTHAAGVVISRDPLDTVVPLLKNDGQVTTQFAMADIEKVGLLKMDILGLRNLTVMEHACRLIKQNHGVELDLDGLEPTDLKTYELLCSGYTIGVFQLESRGMRQLIKDLKPQVFEDIIALLALYRPGPLGSGMVQDFISNKSGKTKVKYELEVLEPILKDTYGMIVYQEQVMQIASSVGGFSLGQADMLRRAMGKKKKDVMDEMRKDFMDGAKSKNFPEAKAKRIFDLCYKFAEYGFNKSHSAAYALISYQTAWLKANYPKEYMAALLSSVVGFTDKVSLYIQECQRMGIEVLRPDVNESTSDFTIVEGGIRFGLGAVKNVGQGAIESIIENRKEKPYESISDMCLRVDLKQTNKRVIESLVKSGALDSLGLRSKLLSIHERILEQSQVIVKERSNGQTSMFSQIGMGNGVSFSEESEDYDILSPRESLRMEKEMLGLYISGHPLDQFSEKLEGMVHKTDTITTNLDGQNVDIMGVLTNTRKIITRSKKEMLIGDLEDLKGSIPVLAFQTYKIEEFNRIAENFVDDYVVTVKGKVRVNGDEVSLSCEELYVMDQIKQRQLHIDARHIDDPTLIKSIQDICKDNRGSMPLYLHVGEKVVLAHKKYWITDDSVSIARVESLLGNGLVWVT